jgi:hypothetical protein
MCPLRTEIPVASALTILTNENNRDYIKNIRFFAISDFTGDTFPEFDENQLIVPDALEEFHLKAPRGFVSSLSFVQFLDKLLGSKLEVFDMTLTNLDLQQIETISKAVIRSKASLRSYTDAGSSLGLQIVAELENLKELSVFPGMFGIEVKLPAALEKIQMRGFI